MADPLHSTHIGDHPAFQATSTASNTITFTISTIPDIEKKTCPVCNGKRLVFGADGKPYLCPKCDGDGYDKDKTTYPSNPCPIYPYTPWIWPWPTYYCNTLPYSQGPITIC
jgi:hypothetical protein